MKVNGILLLTSVMAEVSTFLVEDPFMRVIGRMIWPMARVDLSIVTLTFTKETGKTTCKKDMVYTNMRMAHYIRVNG